MADEFIPDDYKNIFNLIRGEASYIKVYHSADKNPYSIIKSKICDINIDEDYSKKGDLNPLQCQIIRNICKENGNGLDKAEIAAIEDLLIRKAGIRPETSDSMLRLFSIGFIENYRRYAKGSRSLERSIHTELDRISLKTQEKFYEKYPKTTPMKAGSKEYYECLDESYRMMESSLCVRLKVRKFNIPVIVV